MELDPRQYALVLQLLGKIGRTDLAYQVHRAFRGAGLAPPAVEEPYEQPQEAAPPPQA